jgi:hypothetical protein
MGYKQDLRRMLALAFPITYFPITNFPILPHFLEATEK